MRRAILLAVVPAMLAFGQSGETNIGEVGAYTGGVFGIGSHPTAGINFTTALSRYTMFGAEFGFAPLGSNGYVVPPGAQVSHARLFDFNGGVHVRIPVRPRWEPYIAIGAGVIHSTAEQLIVSAGGDSTEGIDHNSFAFHIGTGLRYFIRNNWGVRPEWKYYAASRNFSKLTIGVFYQFQ